MIVLGLDPSSSKVGVALVEDDKPKFIATWMYRPKDGWTESNIAAGLCLCKDDVVTVIKDFKPDLVVIEKVAVSQNMDSVRKIAYFEAACMMAASERLVECVQVRVTAARKAVLGKGNINKEEARKLNEVWYQGPLGPDESDALTMARWAFH